MHRNHEDYATLITKTARVYADIEDALQEAWLCYFEADHSFDESDSRYFVNYLQQKLRWHFKNLIRARQKRKRARKAAIGQQRSGGSATHGTVALPAGKALPRRTATAIALFAHGRSLSEVARIMKVRPQTISNLLRRAARRLPEQNPEERRAAWEDR